MVLSICLAVYNQIDIVRENLSELIKYKGDDIEIIVSDDCSKDPICKMVDSFQDARIRYCKTSENRSHDGNIINGLRACRGDYIFLLRSKDQIIAEKIPEMLSVIERNYGAAYFLFSALDNHGDLRMPLKDKVYCVGKEAQTAHGEILVHPSGQVYKRNLLRLDLYERYIEAYFPEFNGCCVHQLIRMDLSMNGNFVTSSCVTWIYPWTLELDDRSVIQTQKKKNIYAPYFQHQRYQCEFDFIDNEIPENNKKLFFLQIIKKYSVSITAQFYVMNKDKRYHRHYNSFKESFSPYKELGVFKNISLNKIEKARFLDKDFLKVFLKRQTKKVFWISIPRAKIKGLFVNNQWILKHRNKLRKLFCVKKFINR